MNTRWLFITSIFLTSLIGMLPAQSLEKQLDDDMPDDYQLGIIFSAPNILLDIESFEGGIGGKILRGTKADRISADIFYAHSSALLSISGIYAKEYHTSTPTFTTFDISPYLGWFAGGGIVWQRMRIDANNGTNDISIPLEGGALIGAELFLFPFLSVFAEYQMAFLLESNIIATKIAGNTSSTLTMNILIDSKMGNSGKLGVVLYLPEKTFSLKKVSPEV